MPTITLGRPLTRLHRANRPSRPRFRTVVSAITTVALSAGLAMAWSPAAAAVSQLASCVDGGGIRWSSRAIWGSDYRATDGSLRASVDYAGWTTSRAGTVPTDSIVRTYDGAGMLVQTLTWTGGFDYKSGTAYKIRNPKDPVSAPGRAKVTTTLGVDGDGFGNCTVTFTQPNRSSAPAPTPGTACIGQAITPTSNVQTTVTNAPTGTTFCFAPGTYNVSITPRAGQIFDGGNRAAIFDGQSTRANAFRASGVANVTIRGFVIKSYRSPLQSAAIQSFGSTGWTIENNHITRNAATAVATDSGAKVLNNLMDHNGQQGYAVHGAGILYEGNEISYNNENLAVDATWEAGGGKAWATKNAVFRSNHVHHNGGHGLWDDTNNIYITYDRNNVHDNWGGGIYHEIGYDATITGNTITNNGTPSSQGGGEDLGWLWDAGILLPSLRRPNRGLADQDHWQQGDQQLQRDRAARLSGAQRLPQSGKQRGRVRSLQDPECLDRKQHCDYVDRRERRRSGRIQQRSLHISQRYLAEQRLPCCEYQHAPQRRPCLRLVRLEQRLA